MVHSLEEISGIGKKTARVLREAGINSVEDLASFDFKELIKLKGIGKSSAQKYINNAKSVLERFTKEMEATDIQKEEKIEEKEKELIEETESKKELIKETEEIEQELIAGVEEDPSLKKREKIDLNFWNKPPFSSLLDSELAKESEVVFYGLGNLVNEFFDKMLKENFINYKISGIALKNSAILHHYKISSVIKEEEEIQKQEEIEKLRKRHERSIPKSLPQPVRPKMEIATKDELFEAMRSAIIETMQKKEKLKRRRIRREQKKQQKLQMRSKAKLPKEILKHISGKEQTVEELHESWLKRIKAIINFNDKNQTSLFELMQIINNEEKTNIGRKFSLVRLFFALMFLSTGGASNSSKMSSEIQLEQENDFKNINIELK